MHVHHSARRRFLALGIALAPLVAAPVVAVAADPEPPIDPPVPGVSPEKQNISANGSLTQPAMLFYEDFDDLELPEWFSHDGPDGWEVTASDVTTGEGRWRGWTFSDVRQWTWAAGTDERHWFTRGSGNFAIMESEHQRLAYDERFTTGLTTPDFPVAGEDRLVASFDSHYRQGSPEQRGVVTVSFDTGEEETLLELTEDRYSSHEELEFAVPEDATTARLTFSYEDSYNDYWWAVDNVGVHRPYEYADDEPNAVIDVVSDVHADGEDITRAQKRKWARAMGRLESMYPQGDMLVVNGDFVDTMAKADYERAEEMVGEHPYHNDEVLWVWGNHEVYGTEGYETALKRYLDFTGMDKPYAEREVGGVVVLAIGTEYYDDEAQDGNEPFYNPSDEQLAWLKERLDAAEAAGKPVVICTHYPLPNTVSGTHSAWYQNDYNRIEELNDAIAGHENVMVVTGHTHHIHELNDWWGRYTMPDDVGYGVPAVNTAAVKEGIVPEGDHDERTLLGDHSSGVRLTFFDDHVTVDAVDFVKGGIIQSVTLPIGPSGRQVPAEEGGEEPPAPKPGNPDDAQNSGTPDAPQHGQEDDRPQDQGDHRPSSDEGQPPADEGQPAGAEDQPTATDERPADDRQETGGLPESPDEETEPQRAQVAAAENNESPSRPSSPSNPDPEAAAEQPQVRGRGLAATGASVGAAALAGLVLVAAGAALALWAARRGRGPRE